MIAPLLNFPTGPISGPWLANSVPADLGTTLAILPQWSMNATPI